MKYMIRCFERPEGSPRALLGLLCAGLVGLATSDSAACTRAVYFGEEGQTVTGRTMDWLEEMHTDLWIFPRGMQRDSGMGEESFRWTSKYGSVSTSVYEGGTADGMNEKGLVVNLLFLVESEYPSAEKDNRPLMPVSAWAQYVLDSFATVEEAVDQLRKDVSHGFGRCSQRRRGQSAPLDFRRFRRLGHPAVS